MYYSVLQSTTPVLLCTTKYYNVLLQYYKVLLQYYKVLLQYYSVLQSTTPVLLCTTKYYSATTLYYKVLLCTTQYYASTTLYYPVLQRTTLYYKVLRQYYNVLLQYYSVLQSTTPVLQRTTPWASIHANLIWAYLYFAGKPGAATDVVENTTGVESTTPVLIRYYSVLQSTTHPPLRRPYSSHPGDAFSTKKYNISRSGYLPKCQVMLRLPRKVPLQPHQTLRLPRKINHTIDPGYIWNVISNAWNK